MNKCFIIGNLTADPTTATTPSGVSLCRFTIAVNRKAKEGQNAEADFFNITAWRQLGEICSKYLAKGRKVAVIGSVSAHAYTRQNGEAVAQLDVTAEDVEFLTPKQETTQKAQEAPKQTFIEVKDELLPWEVQ